MAIVDIDYADGLKLLYKPQSVDHKALLLVTSGGERKASIMPFTSWIIMPMSPQGWHVSVYIFTKHFSHSLLEQTGQFTVNVPRDGMEEVVEYCGSVSGRDHNKFEERNLTKVASKFVTPPLIGECSVHLECEILQTSPFLMTFPGQDKKPVPMTVFEAQLLAMHAQEDIVSDLANPK